MRRGTFSRTKHDVNLLRLQQAGVILSDYATFTVEILADNGAPESAAVHDALDTPWAKIVGHIVANYTK